MNEPLIQMWKCDKNQTLCDVHENIQHNSKLLVDIVELDFWLDAHRSRHLLEKRSIQIAYRLSHRPDWGQNSVRQARRQEKNDQTMQSKQVCNQVRTFESGDTLNRGRHCWSASGRSVEGWWYCQTSRQHQGPSKNEMSCLDRTGWRSEIQIQVSCVKQSGHDPKMARESNDMETRSLIWLKQNYIQLLHNFCGVLGLGDVLLEHAGHALMNIVAVHWNQLVLHCIQHTRLRVWQKHLAVRFLHVLPQLWINKAQTNNETNTQ